MIDPNEGRYRQQVLSRLDKIAARLDQIAALLREQMGKPTVRTDYEQIGPLASDQTVYRVRAVPEDASDEC